MGALGSSSIIWAGTGYSLEILHQYDKRIKTKRQKFLGHNSYVCRSYMGKTGRGAFYTPTPHPSFTFLFMEAIPLSGSLYLVWDMAPIEKMEQLIS